MRPIVDFHTHVFPDYIGQWISDSSLSFLSQRFFQARKHARFYARPFLGSIHSVQTSLRYFPELIRKNLDEVWSLVPLLGTALESTYPDLLQSMKEAGIDLALIVAHPPYISNEFILSLAAEDQRLIPVVNIPQDDPHPKKTFKQYLEQGARALKIHPAADGEEIKSPRYRTLLDAAKGAGIPVILHTGHVHASLFYRKPLHGKAENFSRWFKAYPDIKFILSHMNFHDPQIALDLCEEYPHLFVDTSWQPAEVIGEAVRRIGAERVLFASDWPLIGNNMTIGRRRIEDCMRTGMLDDKQADLILGENAVRLLGIKQMPPTHAK